jgi:hypothetical protein
MEPGREVRPAGANQAAPDEFPLPFVLTGQKPNLPAPRAPSKPDSKTAPSTAVSARKSTGGTLNEPITANSRNAQDAKATADPAAPKNTTKPISIDPKLLEGLLNRNVGRAARPAASE